MINSLDPQVKTTNGLTDLEAVVLNFMASTEQIGTGCDGHIPGSITFPTEAEKKAFDGTLGSLLQKGVIYDAYGGCEAKAMYMCDIWNSAICREALEANGHEFDVNDCL